MLNHVEEDKPFFHDAHDIEMNFQEPQKTLHF